MSEPPAEVVGLLQMMVQQQTVMLQHQAALLQVHSETVRMQGLLLEHLLRVPSVANGATAERQSVPRSSLVADSTTLATGTTDTEKVTPPIDASVSAVAAESTEPLQREVVAGNERPAEADDSVMSATVTALVANRAARYYQPGTSPATVTVRPHDLAVMRRLHELGDVGALILQFGPYKGSTLAQIAMRQPDYLRQLAARAQRPEVRAAAARVVEALQDVPDQNRSGNRRPARRGRPAA